MKVTKCVLVVLQGERTVKNLYKLIGETIIGGISSGFKFKESSLVRTTQRKDIHGGKKVTFMKNETDMVVKPSSSRVVETSSSNA